MKDGWRKGGERWNNTQQIRVSRRFRHHVRTEKKPNAKIHRELCFNRSVCLNDKPAEFHHVDYTNPFKGAWCCFSCHRKVDHGSLKVPQRAIWDYSSLVQARPTSWVEMRPPQGVTPPPEDAPF